MAPAASTSGVKPRVVVGFAEASAAAETVWSLVDAGFDVIAFGRKGRASALRHSRYPICHEIAAPETDLPKTEADLEALLKRLAREQEGSPTVLFPLDDTAVWVCRRQPLPRGWTLAGPNGATADLALDKYLQTRMASEAGFNVPATALVRTATELLDFAIGAGFPIILKPAECVPTRDGRMIQCRKWVCADRAELDRAVVDWQERVPLLAQSFVSGTGEGVFALAQPGGIVGWSAHRRLRMMNPQGSGSSACVSQNVPVEARRPVEALIAHSGWQGLFMVELLRDQSGKLWFVELNGRPWGSMALSRRQGFEYPAWHVKAALSEDGDAWSPPAAAPGFVCRHVGRELMHLLFVLRGPRSRALNGWPSIWTSLGGVLGVSPRDGVYNWRREDPKVFMADCYYTLRDHLFKSSR
jgi:hypothetical protein